MHFRGHCIDSYRTSLLELQLKQNNNNNNILLVPIPCAFIAVKPSRSEFKYGPSNCRKCLIVVLFNKFRSDLAFHKANKSFSSPVNSEQGQDQTLVTTNLTLQCTYIQKIKVFLMSLFNEVKTRILCSIAATVGINLTNILKIF